MGATHSIHTRFIKLVETSEEKHHEESVFSEDFPYYPIYKAGDTVFLRITKKGEVSEGLRQFIVVDVHHSLNQHLPISRLGNTTTVASLTIYVREIE